MHRITKIPRLRLLFRLLYRPYAAVCGNSLAVTTSLASFAGKTRLVTVENGIDLALFDSRSCLRPAFSLPEDTGPVVAAVGRLLPHKGQALLIEAFSAVVDAIPTACLWIVGDGSERESLVAAVQRAGLQERVHLLGRREDIPALLAQATLFAHASAVEGMSNAVLEGMAAGLASVVADAPGVSECHVHGLTGLVVPRAPCHLGQAMIQLLSDPALREQMGQAARRRVAEHYSMEANRLRYVRLFERLAGRGADSSPRESRG